MAYKIVKNVTNFEEMVTSNKRKSDIPFEEMEVGDVIFVDDRNQKSVYQSAYTIGKALGMKFVVKNVMKDGKQIVGVQRVAMNYKPKNKDGSVAKYKTKEERSQTEAPKSETKAKAAKEKKDGDNVVPMKRTRAKKNAEAVTS